jgi:large subunit ribosomal protein L17
MRHAHSGRKLGRPTDHRIAMMRNLVTSLVLHGRIQTTTARAKELRKVADRMVTLGKRGTLHTRRLAARTLRTPEAVQRLFSEIAPGFAEREGGYTRILRVGNRHGDNAEISLIEFMPPGPPEKKVKVPKSVAPRVATGVEMPITKERFDEPSGEPEAS